MDVVNTQNTLGQSGASTVQVPEAEETSSSALASDFETFLRLLTTQLQNQDPSKPIDSTEFVAQLASFSAVEQQINTNTKLDELISQVNGGVTSDLSKWIGADVKSEAPTIFSGNSIDAFYSIPNSADTAQLVVKNKAGTEIDRRSIDVNSTEFSWDGKDTSLNDFPEGEYSFSVESFEATKSLGLQAAQTFSTVNETRLTDGAIELVFSDGSKMPASNVTAVRGN